MHDLIDTFSGMARSVQRRSVAFLREEMDVEILQIEDSCGPVEELKLHDVTAIVGVGNSVNLLVAFSFEQRVIDELAVRFLADVDVPAGQESVFLRESAMEIVNIIIGHCTADLGPDSDPAFLSPAVIVEGAKRVIRPKNAVFSKTSMITSFGRIDVGLVGPRELFKSNLDLAS